ncbi:MAG: YtxH domain-containing protein [Gemmatimonadaceae bacterium]
MREYDYDSDEPFVVIEKEAGSTTSFLWGLALGAGLALLFAPQSGEDTRREIGTRAGRVRRRAENTAGELTDNVRDRYERARQTVEDRIDDARSAIELKKRQASNAIRAGREAAQDAREELERRIAETKAAYQTGADVARASRPFAATSAERDADDDAGDGSPGI